MVATAFPEAMVHGMGSDTAECLHPAILGADWLSACTAHDAVVLGPGLSQRAGTADVVDGVLASGANRIVLDADALNLLAGRTERLRNLRSQLVLTPHPGEAGRLLGTSAAAVQADRPAALRALVEQTGATVVLKGAGTLVGTPGRGIHMLLAGNPGMATGGSGDVLAGLLGGLLAQGMAPFDAARMAVWWHAAAGDLAAWQGTQASLTAADILRCLPAAARWVMVR
jgi:NAD(P)H-hydrate epimerase